MSSLRIEVSIGGDHTDFPDVEVERQAAAIRALFRDAPPRPDDAVLVSQSGTPERMTRSALVAWLGANRLGSLRRRVETRQPVPNTILGVVIGDEGVRIHELDIDSVAPLASLAAPVELRAAIFLMPAIGPRVGGGTQGVAEVLGRLVGGAT